MIHDRWPSRNLDRSVPVFRTMRSRSLMLAWCTGVQYNSLEGSRNHEAIERTTREQIFYQHMVVVRWQRDVRAFHLIFFGLLLTLVRISPK